MTDQLIPLAERIALREDEAAALLGISESELARLRLRGGRTLVTMGGIFGPLAVARSA